jgi:cell division protease FtsH
MLLIFDEISTGASDDLDKVTEIARSMVTRFGMSETAGQIVYEPQRQVFLGDVVYGTSKPREYSDGTAEMIDSEIRTLVDQAFAEASAILRRRRADLERGAKMLLEKETLTADDFPALKPEAEAKTDAGPQKVVAAPGHTT